MSIFVQPLIQEYEFVQNIDKMFRIISTKFKFTNKDIKDFNNIYIRDSYYHHHTYTTKPYDDKYYFKYYREYWNHSKYDITNEEIKPILEMYQSVSNLIDFNLFIKMFVNKKDGNTFKTVLFELYLMFNMFLGKWDEVVNLNPILNTIILGDEKDKSTPKSMYINNIYKKYSSLSKYDIVKKIHKLLQKNKTILQGCMKQQPKSSLKCFKPNCDGNIEKHNHQSICLKCGSIFCTKCRIEIYPECIQCFNNGTTQIKPNPKYNLYTKEQQQGKYSDKYKDFKNHLDEIDFDTEEDEYIKYYKLLNHDCTEEDLGTVKLLTEDVKGCPKCNFPIYKISGCDHMWCTQCHTMFNWSNLKITQTTTNPHYYAWLRQQGITPNRENHPDAQPANNDCNQQLNVNQCAKIIFNSKIKPDDQCKLSNLSKALELVLKPQNDGRLDEYRLKYIYGLIDKDKYIKYISTLYISKFFIDNYNMIITNTIYMISSYFNQLQQNIRQNANYNTIDYNTINELVKIHNDGMNSFTELYKNFVVSFINKDTYEINNVKNDKQMTYKQQEIPIIKLKAFKNCASSPIYATDDQTKTDKYLEISRILNNPLGYWYSSDIRNLYFSKTSSFNSVDYIITKYSSSYIEYLRKFKVDKNDFIIHYCELKNNVNKLITNNKNVMERYSLSDYFRDNLSTIMTHFFKYYKNEAIQEFLKNGLNRCAQVFINHQYKDIRAYDLKADDVSYIVCNELKIMQIFKKLQK